jgi:pimeloyl-ACP methyl ester carboxylesterase
VISSLAWHERIGRHRDWVWRGWQTRYTYVPNFEKNAVPLLLLHGFGASIGHWRHNLHELGQQHPVYALDMLGFGASEKAAASYNVELWVEQIYDFWKEFIRRPVVLVGNSIGSQVCLITAAVHPEMVQGIVMVNLPDASVLEMPRWLQKTVGILRPISQPPLTLVKALFTAPPVFNLIFWLIRQPRFIRFWAKQAYATPTAITEELLEILSGPARDRGAARTLRKMIQGKSKGTKSYSAKTILPQLEIPILLFWGLKDMMVPPKLAPLFLNYNSNLQLIEIENAGHCPHDEYPEFVNQQILDWLRLRVYP